MNLRLGNYMILNKYRKFKVFKIYKKYVWHLKFYKSLVLGRGGGIPQGSIFGPVLVLADVNNVPDYLKGSQRTLLVPDKTP